VSQTVSTLSLTSTGGVGSGKEAVLSFNLSGASNDSLTSTGTLTLTGSSFNLNLNGTATGTDNLVTWLAAGSTSLTTGNVDLTYNGTSYGLSNPALSIVSSSGNDILEFNPAAVPEPRPWVLLLTGLGVLLLAGYRYRLKLS
jgi:hypothetical protein